MEDKFWGDMLNVLKDINTYFEKQDAFQERANIKPAPKIAENPKAIEGGEMPAQFKPAEKIAKSTTVETDEPVQIGGGSAVASSNESMAKADEEEEVPPEDEEAVEAVEEVEEGKPDDEWVEEEEDKEEGEEEELKSILKDIRSALQVNQTNATDLIKSELKKALPNIVKGETDKMLRKMGFAPTRPDVSKLGMERGIDSTDEVAKSEDIKKSSDGVEKIVDDLTKMSWRELGQLREKTEGFQPFKR
jgi:uncharacterized FlaG/YvyC family protein